MQISVGTNSYMMITAQEFTRVLDSCLCTIRYRDVSTSPHFPRECAIVGKSAKKLIETYLRQRRILKQSEGENKDTSVRTRDYLWVGRCTKNGWEEDFGKDKEDERKNRLHRCSREKERNINLLGRSPD